LSALAHPAASIATAPSAATRRVGLISFIFLLMFGCFR
jgi:hypothetical protein